MARVLFPGFGGGLGWKTHSQDRFGNWSNG